MDKPRKWDGWVLLDREGEVQQVLAREMSGPAVEGLKGIGWSVIPVSIEEKQ